MLTDPSHTGTGPSPDTVTVGKYIMIIIIIMPTYLSQYEVAVNTNPRVWCKTPLMKQIHYGELHEILICEVPDSRTLNAQSSFTHLLMLMSNCKVYTDTTMTPASYASISDTIALALVSSVCGRFPVRERLRVRCVS